MRAILGFALALFLLPACASAKDPLPAVSVRLDKLEKGSLPRILRVYGRVRAAPSSRRHVVAPLSAVVVEIFVRRGEEVAKGAPLVRIEPSPQAAAAYAEAVSAFDVAMELARRTRTMVGGHLATAEQLARAEKAQADARSSLSALKAEGAGGPRTLCAPFHAIVTKVAARAGEIVREGAALVDLARPEGLVLEAGAITEHAAELQPRDPARIDALGAGDAVLGRVVAVGSLVDPSTGLVPVEISLPDGRFLPGERAEAQIVAGKASGYVVPHSAILVDDEGRPYVVEALNRVAKKVPVRILAEEDGKDVVGGRFDRGASLVLAGNYQLESGMRLRVAGARRKTGR